LSTAALFPGLAEWALAFDLEKNDLKEPNPNKRKSRIARTEDVVRTRGELDVSKILPIMAPRPTIADIEEASMWLGGDRDVSGPAIKGRCQPNCHDPHR
jgi:hypothetical protein